MTQTYLNTYDSYIETEYYFPITPGFCFISFEAEIDNKTVKGVIKEKEEAKQEYIENKK